MKRLILISLLTIGCNASTSKESKNLIYKIEQHTTHGDIAVFSFCDQNNKIYISREYYAGSVTIAVIQNGCVQ